MQVAACGARAVLRRLVRARTGAPPNVAFCERLLMEAMSCEMLMNRIRSEGEAGGCEGMWSCRLCTFDNTSAHTLCEMCFTPRVERMGRVTYHEVQMQEAAPRPEGARQPPAGRTLTTRRPSRFRGLLNKVRACVRRGASEGGLGARHVTR